MARTEAVDRTSPKTLALRRRDRELTEPRGSAYRLLLRVASGGMASVYVGVRRADASQELVAIKRSHPHLLDNPTFAKALATEAYLLARMHHPNVVGIRELEECDDDLLLVMDYVEGASLSGLLKLGANAGKPMPAPIAVRIVLDACAGLAEAHELTDAHGSPAGVVHRDVSPQNILVRVDGVARVADFGIAKLTSSDATATDTGLLKGKVNYMSPEYVVLGTQDARGDVFALGVVLWEALVGKRPFEAANEVGVLRLIAAGAAPPPSKHAPSLGNALDAVVGRALARSVNERYPTARAFAAALGEASREASLVATHEEVAAWLEALASEEIAERRSAVVAALSDDTGLRDAPRANEATFRSETVVVDFTVALPPPRARRPRRLVLAAGTFLLVTIGLGGSWVHFARHPPYDAAVPRGIAAEAKPTDALVTMPAPEATPVAIPAAPEPSPNRARPSRSPPTKAAGNSRLRAPPNPY